MCLKGLERQDPADDCDEEPMAEEDTGETGILWARLTVPWNPSVCMGSLKH